MTEQEALTELIERYELSIHNNDFPSNPYYKSSWEERKEVILKRDELKQILCNIKN